MAERGCESRVAEKKVFFLAFKCFLVNYLYLIDKDAIIFFLELIFLLAREKKQGH